MPARYLTGLYPQKIAYRAQPLGPLPSGRFVAAAADEAGRIWAVGTAGLLVGNLQAMEVEPLPPGLALDEVQALLFLPGVESAVLIVLHPGDRGWQRELEGGPWEAVPLHPGPDLLLGDLNLSALARQGRARLLLQIHDHAWLVVLDGELVTIGADGFVEPLPSDFGAPPIKELTKGLVAPDGSWWFASPRGVCQLRDGEWEYFAGQRWLNSDQVNDIAVDAAGRLWAATEAGLCCLAYQPMRLQDKAAHFETLTRTRHLRRGYCCANRLAAPGQVTQYVPYASDNDGLWTSLYVAAESFRYATTGEEEARQLARQGALALCRLEEVTPIPGLVARALVAAGERVIKSTGEWHATPDGQYEWKGDVSSDELDGHYFAFSVYWDLAADAAGRETVARTVEKITDHLLANEYFMIDVDGEPTTWAFFAPAWLNITRADQRGLNSLQMLSYLRTAHHLTGHQRYLEHYRRLIEHYHYALNVLHQKITWPGHVNYSDDELAFLVYYPLLRYEDDPRLRQLYLLSLERHWQLVRPQRCPLWNAIYAALTGKFCAVEELVQTLAEMPLELVDWPMANSHRADVEVDPVRAQLGEPHTRRLLPYDERADFRWNHNPYRPDGGGEGRVEYDGAHYLLPYWLARYHGLIAEAFTGQD
jgi:hypothetical protein